MKLRIVLTTASLTLLIFAPPQTAWAQTTKELDAAQVRVLPEPMPSVTEHTTRTFEPSFIERNKETRLQQ
jgi:hypothetical protein